MKSILRLLTLLLLLSACSSGKQEKKKGVTAPVQSAPYEMLIVANKEWLQTTAGQSLMSVAESDVEGLAMHEPCFRCTKINPVNFDGTFKMYGNIIVAEISSKYRQAEMRVSRNLYCRPQLIVFLAAPNDKAFIELIDSRRDQLLDMFNEQEFNRESLVLQKKHSGVVAQQAQKQFGVSLFAPADIDQVKTGKDFFWASASKQEFRLNICLYTLPLRNLTLEDFVAARDSVMQINIPGGHEGQWMETDSRTVSSKVRQQTQGHDIMVVRGLWDMRGDAMGGPFVSYIQTDERQQRILVCEGFVFAPNEKKRPLIRELEAALQTLKFTDDTHF
ncbi:MAG: DUF4837 family protein [Bacteroidaceae bacterium]|nr:DUF4837 family protein [Bacteroidaceae bacterium]